MGIAARKPRLYGGLSAEERRAERRARLIEAGVKVYGEVGYRNATVKAVCAAAELTERYFYESFANSEALLVAAYIHVTDKLHAEMAAAGAAARNGARTADVLTLYFTRLKQNPQPSRVFLLEMNGISDAVDAVRMDSLKRMSAVLLPGRAGADAADAVAVRSRARGVSVRLGKVEGTEASESDDVSLRVFVGKRVASVSATANSDPKMLAERAVAMARVSPEDPFQGLADSTLLAAGPADLDLFDAAEIPTDRLKDDALAMEEAALGPWLLTVVKNAWIDRLRRSGRERPLDAPERVEATLEDDAPDVTTAWSRLPEDERLVGWLKLVVGMTFRDIADVLGTSKSAVARTWARMLARMRGALR